MRTKVPIISKHRTINRRFVPHITSYATFEKDNEKTITLILLIFISYPYVNAQCGIGYDYDNKNITDLEKRNLNGKVKSVTYSHYDIVDHFGEISKGSKNCEQEMFFNRDSTVSKIIESDFQFPRKDVDIHEYEKRRDKINQPL